MDTIVDNVGPNVRFGTFLTFLISKLLLNSVYGTQVLLCIFDGGPTFVIFSQWWAYFSLGLLFGFLFYILFYVYSE